MTNTLLVIAMALIVSLGALPRDRATPTREAAMPFACQGCFNSQSSGDGGGAVSFPNEPNLDSGDCTGQPGACVASTCNATGTLTIRNNHHASIWYSQDGGVTRVEIPAGNSVNVTINDGFGPTCSKDSDTSKTVTFYSTGTGPGGLSPGIFYTITCTKCAG